MASEDKPHDLGPDAKCVVCSQRLCICIQRTVYGGWDESLKEKERLEMISKLDPVDQLMIRIGYPFPNQAQEEK